MNRLTLLKPHIRKNKDRGWVSLYKCSCGNETEVADSRVRHNRILSCGCLKKERCTAACKKNFTTHGLSKTKEYRVWGDMIARCYILSQTHYSYYGGRGITVCDRWRTSFEAFLEDLGPCPAGLSIERINNDGNYEPANCKWATKSEQMKNRRPLGSAK